MYMGLLTFVIFFIALLQIRFFAQKTSKMEGKNYSIEIIRYNNSIGPQ